VISISAFACLFLLLHFELSAIRAIPQTDDYSVEGGSRYGGGSLISLRSNELANVNSDNNIERADLPSNSDVYNAYGVSAVERETTEEKKPSCPKPQEESRFREVDKETLVYSVWFDDRKKQNFIRIMLLTSTRNPLPPLNCYFKGASKQKTFTSEASFYQHNENHRMLFGSFIASCAIPQEVDNIPCFVNISTSSTAEKQNKSNSVVFPVGFIDRLHSTRKTMRGKYGICIPPVHGDISVDKLIEFLELSQILGASHFTFYDLAMSESMREVLKYYQNKGIANVLPWNLPAYINRNDVHYFAQPLSIMDCLYRSMIHLHFVAFNDLDEFIVPLRHDNMSALLEEIHREEHCGHCFESVIFDPSKDQDLIKSSPLLSQRVLHRTSKATPFWTKCVVDPRRIYEQGIHHISKPIEEYYSADKVDFNVARVFHYRKCQDSRAAMQPKCIGLEVDKTMAKFGEQLLRKFEIRINDLNVRKPKET